MKISMSGSVKFIFMSRPTRYIRLFQTDRTSKDRLRTNVNLHMR